MGIYIMQLKAHSREDITEICLDLNNCVVHGCKPKILKMVSGKRKYIDFVATCKEDDCSKIAETKEKVVAAWNKWNPKQLPPIDNELK